jgi:ribonuclease HI
VSNDKYSLLGVIGVGGVIFNSRGNLKLKFTWRIEIAYNNEAEIHALHKGHLILKSQHVCQTIVVGVSMIVLRVV